MATLKNLTISDIGFLKPPTGTTGQRGVSGETVVTFSTIGTTTWTCPEGVTNIRLLVVGGGGGAGADVGGGGGGGGVIYSSSYVVTPANVYGVVVGFGGNGAINGSGNQNGLQGGNSVFSANVNIISNGTFDTNTTGWLANTTNGTGHTFSAVGGVMSVVRGINGVGFGEPYQLLTVQANKKYHVCVDVGTSRMGCSIGPTLGSGAYFTIGGLPVGKNNFTFTTTSTSAYLLFVPDNISTTSTIDNISVILLDTGTSSLAYGGGYGGGWAGNVGQSGSTIGSAGGGTSNVTGRATTTSGQGNDGGTPGGNTANAYEYSGASGGGGAGGAGGAGIFYHPDRGFEGLTQHFAGGKFGWSAGSTLWGYGGDGLSFDISGTPTFYAGGGGASSDGSTYWGVGGKGGGGNGAAGGAGTEGNGANAATYYGGGGGGPGAGTNNGGAGYRGIVIIAYNTNAGELRYNSTTASSEVLANHWESLTQQVSSSGGTVSTASGYTIRTFTSNGNFTMNWNGTVEVLLIAGGGGGCTIGGGGGGGGYVYQSNVKLNGGIYPVVVGTGGAGATSHSSQDQSSGTPSKFHNLEAIGGGLGASYTGTFAHPTYANGGSGGGGPGGHWDTGVGGVHGSPANTRGLVSVSYGGTAIAGQGHPGGSGSHGHGWYSGFGQTNGLVYAGGGGGGAAAQGGSVKDCDSNTTGGNGMMSTINGSQVYYAGGGGGGVHQPGGQSHYGLASRAGGAGGGATSGASGVNGGTGQTNTGGGGGGGHHSGPNVSGGGGPGIVIVRHKT